MDSEYPRPSRSTLDILRHIAMLTENRRYHYSGQMTLSRSRVLDEQAQPAHDIVNWLFLESEGRQYSFVYHIDDPIEAQYGRPFQVMVAFTMIEAVMMSIALNREYVVLRGQEIIGAIVLTESML